MLAKQRQDRPSMAQVEAELEKVNIKVERDDAGGQAASAARNAAEHPKSTDGCRSQDGAIGWGRMRFLRRVDGMPRRSCRRHRRLRQGGRGLRIVIVAL